ncbi:GntR family transcriptional regulator [Streptomyces sp. NPDC058385]|uniref:GntR family transcriptional regulator n=1 Tax=unclassified Streptomyces TaxID=2593676 RepID=UPI00364BEEDF
MEAARHDRAVTERLPLPRAGDPQSEAAFVEKYGVPRDTVRRAVRDLETAGHVEARHGVGRFVSSRP